MVVDDGIHARAQGSIELKMNGMEATVGPGPTRRGSGESRQAGAAKPRTERISKAGPSSFTVLIVDDVEDTRDLYAEYFKFKGARVLTAADGLSALAVLQQERPDVVVLDLAMPGVTGWDVIRRMKADAATCSIPIVVLSGQSARESACEAGADSYLSKPCIPDVLMDEVTRVLHDHP
jgi:two-component system, cell cycle response regulator DivK